MIGCDRRTVIATLALALIAVTIGTATPVLAEQAVGLEAQGVDVEAALNNPDGLDVRDAFGRPVSAALIREQLKRAQAQAAAEASYASRLPQARRVTWMLELLAGLPTALAAAAGETLWRAIADAGLPRPPQPPPAFVPLVFILALLAAARRGAVFAYHTLSFTRSAVLRC